MSRNSVLSQPTTNSDVLFDDWYDEMSQDWPRKAAALQIRRWRALKQEVKGRN